MRKFVVSSEHFTGELIFGYDSAEMILLFENKAELDEKQKAWLMKHFPVMQPQMSEYFPKSKIVEVTDLSFDRFWRQYEHKVGNKTRTQKLWTQLPETDRIKIFETLPKYFKYLKKSGIAKAYPETYIAQCRWENEY